MIIMKYLIKVFNLGRVKSILMHFMLVSGVFYLIDNKLDWNLSNFKNLNTERTIILVEFLFFYWLIYFVFYKGLKYILRYFFHSKLRDRVKRKRNQYLEGISQSDKKELVVLTDGMAEIYYQYFVKMGFITSSDISEPLEINNSEKEELFNKILEDIYSWFLLIFHSFITVLIVFQFYAWWFISLVGIIIVILILLIFFMVYFLMNLEILELVRKKLLKRSNSLM